MTVVKVDIKGLDDKKRKLIETARLAAVSAYAPYSGFHVGAAVLLSNGAVYTGNNQENVAYGQSLCAERVALLYAAANNPDVPPLAIAIAAMEKGAYTIAAVTPCGACRQVLFEMEKRYNKKIEIIMYGESECLLASSAADLLPCAFSSGSDK